MTISIPCLEDNYCYLHKCRKDQCLIIDASEYEPIVKTIEKNKLKPLALLITHEHHDHTKAAKELYEKFPEIKIFGHKKLKNKFPFISNFLDDGAKVIETDYSFKAIETSAHSESDFCFYFESDAKSDSELSPSENTGLKNAGVLYTGDTIFIGGAGKLFWGNGKNLYQAIHKLLSLPKSTKIYCGHEYTISNLEFALSLEPKNTSALTALKKAKAADAGAKSQNSHIFSTIEDELSYNPFCRWKEKEIVSALKDSSLKNSNPEEVLSSIRTLKDNWVRN